MMTCPRCSASIHHQDRYCAACGAFLQIPTPQKTELESPWRSFSWFTGSLLISLVISFVLSAVFHFPVFILGAFLPLIWRFGRR